MLARVLQLPKLQGRDGPTLTVLCLGRRPAHSLMRVTLGPQGLEVVGDPEGVGNAHDGLPLTGDDLAEVLSGPPGDVAGPLSPRRPLPLRTRVRCPREGCNQQPVITHATLLGQYGFAVQTSRDSIPLSGDTLR